MSYIDRDGDIILESVEEVRVFEAQTDCDICRSDARAVLEEVTGKETLRVVFSAMCTHANN